MDSRKFPALMALVGVVVAVGLFLLLKDDTAEKDTELAGGSAPQGQEPPPDHADEGNQEPKPEPKPEQPETPTIEIRDGGPAGGVQELEFSSGDEAGFEVISDVADELHFHGYDAYIDVAPGKPTTFAFEAEIEGVFELESHTTGVLIAEISVVPD